MTRVCREESIHNFAWQPRFYEHILRSNSNVTAVRDYIDRNPENWLEDPDNPNRLAPTG